MTYEAPLYTCAQCGGVFSYGWSQEEADAESMKLWGIVKESPNTAQVCDDCFREIMASFN